MRYNFSKIESKWQKKWQLEKVYEPNLKTSKKPFYNLMMFPYPSAEGLHVGNMYAFTGSDIYGRFKRMQGNDVFEPIGLDGFGIHSENYALKIGAHPMRQAKISEKRFYKQLEKIGNGFAWNERLETYDPDYYKWTQWIFAQMFKHGLAYRKKQPVNWCPSCKTVLADEQVIAGACERCGTKVEKRELEQWFFKITKYAEKLLGNLPDLDWSEKVKIAQKNWIGKSEGLVFRSPVKDTDIMIETFSAHFEAFTADTFVVIAPDHPLLPSLLKGLPQKEKVLAVCQKMLLERKESGYEERPSVGIFTGRYTVDPVGNGELPIWVASYALAEYGTGIVKCSAHDERDFAFAKQYRIPLKAVLLPPEKEKQNAVRNFEICYTDMQNGILAEPASFAGKRAGDVRQEIVKYCMDHDLAQPKTTYRLRDWLISRQRYWGAPIPMIFCPTCAKKMKGEKKEMPGWYAVPDKDLPVKLPFVKDFRPTGTGTAPLASVKSFYEVKCPACKGKARRETDVSDTFLDSAWYYLRYPNVSEKKRPWNSLVMKKWIPAGMYIGGAEHSVLHLLYVRFMALALQDLQLLSFPSKNGEPFPKFRAHGLLIKEGTKMSKSKGNVVNPDEYVKKFGADVLRMYLMFLAPFEEGGDFRDAGILGPERFLKRVWAYFEKFPKKGKLNSKTYKLLHRSIKKVGEDLENLKFNTAISQLMIFLNDLEARASNNEYLDWGGGESFAKLLAPLAPHMAEEIWRGVLRYKTTVHKEPWPAYDPKCIVENTFKLVIQVNGKVRDMVGVDAEKNETEITKLVLGLPKIKQILGAQRPKRTIYIPKKILNIVI